MRGRGRAIAVLLCLASVSVGCVTMGPDEEVKVIYYEISPSVPPWTGGQVPFTVALRPFNASEVLDHEGIRFRTSDVEGGYWRDDRWSEPIPTMFRDLVQKDLDAAGLFRRVNLLETAGFADLLIDAEIHRLEEVDRGTDWFAVMEITVELSRTSDGNVLFHRRYREEERCASRTVREVVRALTRGAARLLAKLREDLYQNVRGGE